MTPATLVAVATAGLFLHAASFKVLDTSALSATLVELGFPPRAAPIAGRGIFGFEVVVGLSVLGFAPASVGALLVMLAAVGIAIAGLAGLASGSAIRCSCFSTRSTAVLGHRQVILAAALVAVAATLLVGDPSFDAEGSLIGLGLVACTSAALHALTSFRDVAELVRYRRAMMRTYPV